jgi:hypothetical protein
MYSITQDMANLPPFRLKSRKPLWKEEFLMEPFSKSDYWKAAWQDVDIFNKNLIEDPTKQLPGFDLYDNFTIANRMKSNVFFKNFSWSNVLIILLEIIG